MHNRCKKNLKLKIAYHSERSVSFTNNFKYPKIRPEGPKIWGGAEQNSSIIRVSEQNFEQNKRFLRALPAGISNKPFYEQNLSRLG